MQIFEKSKFTQLEMTKGSIASLVLTQYFDLLENSLSCGTFGLLSVGTNLVEAEVTLVTYTPLVSERFPNDSLRYRSDRDC